MPFFCAIPVDTPLIPEGVHSIASAGPYWISSYTPNRRIVLERNPYYRGPRPHNPERIVFDIGISQASSLLTIKRGEADYTGDPLSASAYSELGRTYGVNKKQFFVNPQLSVVYYALNTTRPLFEHNVPLRRAIGFAIDRQALLKQSGPCYGTPATHILPPGVAGYSKQQLYPTKGPDFATARKLAEGHTGDGDAVMYTCNTSGCQDRAQVLQFDLKQIGLSLDVKPFSRAVQFQKEGVRGEPFDIADEGWVADYADPYDFINILLDGTTIHATNNVNFAYFDDPAYNKRMQQAARLSGAARYRAYARARPRHHPQPVAARRVDVREQPRLRSTHASAASPTTPSTASTTAPHACTRAALEPEGATRGRGARAPRPLLPPRSC